MIGRICRIWVKILFVNALMAHRFSRKRGFIYIQTDTFQQFTICRNFCTSINDDNIPNNHIFLGNLSCIAVSYDFNQFVIIHLV